MPAANELLLLFCFVLFCLLVGLFVFFSYPPVCALTLLATTYLAQAGLDYEQFFLVLSVCLAVEASRLQFFWHRHGRTTYDIISKGVDKYVCCQQGVNKGGGCAGRPSLAKRGGWQKHEVDPPVAATVALHVCIPFFPPPCSAGCSWNRCSTSPRCSASTRASSWRSWRRSACGRRSTRLPLRWVGLTHSCLFGAFCQPLACHAGDRDGGGVCHQDGLFQIFWVDNIWESGWKFEVL